MSQAPHHDIAEILRGILEQLPGWSDVLIREDDRIGYRVNAKVRGNAVEFLLELKRGAWRGGEAEDALAKSRRLKLPVVLGTVAIPAKRALALRELGVGYLDTAGNVFLDLPGLQVFRETRGKPLVEARPKRPVGRVFNASAVRVGLQLLLDPALVGSNLRSMSAVAGVSAASAKFALDAFKADGYVIELGRSGRRLMEPEAFFRKWVESYNQSYRPHRILGRYSTGRQNLTLGGGEACWGGEPGADLIMQAIRPAERVVYCYAAKVGALVVKNRLRPDPDGDVVLIDACWDRSQEEPQGTAPAFVLYADLLDTRDPRCAEVAERLFDTILRKRLQVHGD